MKIDNNIYMSNRPFWRDIEFNFPMIDTAEQFLEEFFFISDSKYPS